MQNKFITQTVTCKKCGKLHEIKCYPIINFQSGDEDFIKSVFSLELFKITCDCGAETIVSYDTVIVDMYKKYIVYLYTSNNEEEFYKNVEPTLNKMFSENEKYKEIYDTLKHTRLVHSMNDMLEKLLIFDYDLEDYVIECIKLSLAKNEKFQDEKIQMIYFDKLDGKNLLFTIIYEDQTIQPKVVGIDIEFYNSIIENYNKLNENNKLRPFAKIDANFILNLIESYNKELNDNAELSEDTTDTENSELSENTTDTIDAEKSESSENK